MMRTLFSILLTLFLWIPASYAAKPTPVISFSPTSVSVSSTASIGSTLSNIFVSLSNGSSYSGGLVLTNSAGGVCAESGTTPNFVLTVGKTLTAGQYTCTVQASQGGTKVDKSIVITVTASVSP